MIETLLILAFFGYLLPLVIGIIALGNVKSDEFNNIFCFKNWQMSIYRMGNNKAIMIVPFVNVFVMFRLLFYRIFKK